MSRLRRPGSALAGLAALAAFVADPGLAAGDTARGEVLYAVCSTCHGPDAKGMKELNAPALAGREEWYLVRQIENFRSGIRGSDPKDVYGRQMAPMALVLADAQAIEDVAAYLSSLGD